MLAGADSITAVVIGVVISVNADASWAWALVPLPIALGAAKLLGLYDHDHRSIRHLTVDELPSLAALGAITVIVTMFLAPGTGGAPIFLLLLVGGLALAVALRAAARAWWRAITPRERTLVVGEGESADAIRRKIELFDDMHLQLLRDVATVPTHSVNGFGVPDDVLDRVDRVVLAWAVADPPLVARLLELCRKHQTKLSVVSPFQGLARPALRLSQVAELPVLEYNTWDTPRSTMFLKRAVDLGVSTVGLLILALLYPLIAIAIKLDSPGPILFRQRRAGRHGSPFTMLKFRSMTQEAEQMLGELISLDELQDPMFKLREDPRITRVGRFLRRFSLDELPQLWNVLRGEMSIVGPRPEELPVVERYRPEHRFRLNLKPGLTGPMQVFGRGDLSFSERLAVELDYVENVSLARDIRLLAMTLPALARGKGAF
jgi:exopolysaccharide biosynthesis polyprenyl glycosylphosphotransferase